MKHTLALIGIGTAFLIGCADDAAPTPAPRGDFPAGVEAVLVAGGSASEEGPGIDILQPGPIDDSIDVPTYIDFDLEAVIPAEPPAPAFSPAPAHSQDQLVDFGGHRLPPPEQPPAHQPLASAGPAAPDTPPAQWQTSAATSSDPPAALDPCQCASEQCLQTWIEDNIGCNVCVVFTCGGEPFAHGCNAC